MPDARLVGGSKAVAEAGGLAGGESVFGSIVCLKGVRKMPAGDGTGPEGRGAMTGRRAGYCAGFDVPGYASLMPGRGTGMRRGGFGGGRGWRHWYYATGLPGWLRFGHPPVWGALQTQPLTRGRETAFLKAQAEQLRQQLDDISKRIEELEQED